MTNGGKNKSGEFIFLFSVYITISKYAKKNIYMSVRRTNVVTILGNTKLTNYMNFKKKI